MSENHAAYGELNRQWHSLTSVLLGGEVGELAKYGAWLSEFREPLEFRASSISGKPVAMPLTYYSQNTKCISLDEVDFGRKFASIRMNDIQDFDSLVMAMKEQASYCGNIVLGNSQYVEASASISDSSHVLGSTFISNSKCIFNSSLVEDGEFLFGANNDARSKHVIRGLETCETARSLEVLGTFRSSDCYFSFGLQDCSDCMFCFNLRNKKFAIGNRVLGRERYIEIKNKLLEDMRTELERKARLPSLVSLVAESQDYREENAETFRLVAEKTSKQETKGDLQPIELAFQNTCKLILGKSHSGLEKHRKWLAKYGREVYAHRSVVSGREIVSADYVPFNTYPKDRHVTLEESMALADMLRLEEKEIDGLRMSHAGSIGRIAFFVTQMRRNHNENVIFSALSNSSQNVYWGGLYSYAKYCAISFWPRHAEYIFGSNTVFNSQFCIKCYFSNSLSRCFEVDSSRSCHDSYFLHNCENVRDSMFCFNVKNLRYAIGNVEVGKEKLLAAKRTLLDGINRNLEKTGDVGFGIYDFVDEKISSESV